MFSVLSPYIGKSNKFMFKRFLEQRYKFPLNPNREINSIAINEV